MWHMDFFVKYLLYVAKIKKDTRYICPIGFSRDLSILNVIFVRFLVFAALTLIETIGM